MLPILHFLKNKMYTTKNSMNCIVAAFSPLSCDYIFHVLRVTKREELLTTRDMVTYVKMVFFIFLKKYSCQLFVERERSPIAEWNFDVASPYLLKRNQIHIVALHFNQAPVVPIGRGITSSDCVAWINLCLSKFRSLFNMDQFWFSEVPDFIVKLSITGPWRSITGRKISIKPCNYRFQLRQSSN